MRYLIFTFVRIITCIPARRGQKSQVIIRRHPTTHKGHPRAHISEQITPDSRPISRNGGHTSLSASETPSGSNATSEEPQDEISLIRSLLFPPMIPGVEDWGIPPESAAPPDPALVVCSLVPTESCISFIHPVDKAGPISRSETGCEQSKAFQ